jgi:molybdopterin molybdotransferase
MISVSEAEQHILSRLYSPSKERVALEQSAGRVLAQDVRADRDFPPFDRVMMDGIAIRYSDFSTGVRCFTIEGLLAAGQPSRPIAQRDHCLEIMTGAVMSTNADVVIRYEDVEITGDKATVQVDAVKPGQNIHFQGSDRKKGDLLIPMNRCISAAELGVMATVGLSTVEVWSKPRVLIVSTGDELVEVDETPEPFQIRKSNVHTLQALCMSLGLSTTLVHVADTPDLIESQLRENLSHCEVILLSGGVSKGKLDFVPEVLQKLGITGHFHGVKQRPGKPFWFGTGESHWVFAFPGNPVSTYMCAIRYFSKWLRRSLFQNDVLIRARLGEDFRFMPDLQYFLQVKLEFKGAELVATPVPGQGSGDLSNLTEADGFMELPAERSTFEEGEIFPTFIYRSIW